jgi:hypothetical protein
MWYMPLHIAVHELGGSLYRFSLFEVFVLSNKLACNHFQIEGGLTIAFYG